MCFFGLHNVWKRLQVGYLALSSPYLQLPLKNSKALTTLSPYSYMTVSAGGENSCLFGRNVGSLVSSVPTSLLTSSSCRRPPGICVFHPGLNIYGSPTVCPQPSSSHLLFHASTQGLHLSSYHWAMCIYCHMAYLAIFHSPKECSYITATQSCSLSSVGSQSVWSMPLLRPWEHLLCDYLHRVVLFYRLCRICVEWMNENSWWAWDFQCNLLILVSFQAKERDLSSSLICSINKG